jgi:hypothetical protein
MGYHDEVSAALATLGAGGSTVADAIADPGGAARALTADGLVLRAAPELSGAAAGYAPEPRPPLWLSFSRGSRDVASVSLSGGNKVVRRAARVELEEAEERCCDAPSCSRSKRRTSLWLHLERATVAPMRLLVAEQRTLDASRADAVYVVAHRLAGLLGAPATRSDGTPLSALEEGEPEALLPEPLGSVAAVELARFALRSEGDRIVLRDFASLGPRASATRNKLIGMVLLLIAAIFCFELAGALHGEGSGAAVVFGAAAGLFSLAGTAFVGVARFSARYRAVHSPLVAFGQGRFIVQPWVSRTGAVDLRPEGRLGAAIPLGELRGVSVKRRDQRFAVEFDSDHGPIDALATEREEVARYWAAALARIAAEVSHPSAGASARQRARARAREEADGVG